MDDLLARPLRAEDLPYVEVWFDDSATQRWLGGRDWLRNLLHLADKPDRFALVFMQLDEPVALLDLERNADSAAIAIVVAPSHRKERVASTILQSIFALPAAEHLVEVVGEVEQGNIASERMLRAARFLFVGRTHEGFGRYVLRR